MMFAPNAVMSSPGRTSFAKPSQSIGSSSIDLAEYPGTMRIMTHGGRCASSPLARAARRRMARALAEQPESCSHLGGEQLGLLPGGEVAAPVGLVEVAERGIDLLGPAPRCREDLAGERAE